MIIGIPIDRVIMSSFICISVSLTPTSRLPRVRLPNMIKRLFITYRVRKSGA